jgi:Cro/C1-type HTH DNA-binding domain
VTARRAAADDHPDGDAAPGNADAAGAGAPIVVRLDDLLADRGMTLTELAERVGITIVNLSILKTAGRGRSASPPWPASARCSAASPVTCSATSQTATRAAPPSATGHRNDQDPATGAAAP